MEQSSPFASIELLAHALSAHGVGRETFTLDGNEYSRFLAPSGKVWLVEHDHINYPFTSATVQKISKEKYLAHALAALQGVRSPETIRLSAMPTAEELATLLARKPLVVKPSNASLSNGVSLNITTKEQLEAAIGLALNFSDSILAQEQIEGDEIRFVVIGGRTTAALLRETPHVVGDGNSTVETLIRAENKSRLELQMPYLTYPELNDAIVNLESINSQSIPAKDEVVELGRGTMIKTGASIYDVVKEVDPTYKVMAEKLAASLGAHFIVVDMILRDYKNRATADNYAFLEFNAAPVLRLFYSCRDGKHYDIVADLLPGILSSMGVKADED